MLTFRDAGRAAALELVLLLSVAGGLPAQQDAPPPPSDPHGELACAACHRGPKAGREVGAVPAATCTASGCHVDGGPAEVRVSTVVFDHRDHGDTAAVELGCAGCHGHDDGGAPIRPTLDACGLCHADQLGGEDPAACLACHGQPEHVPTTNQGVPIPHGELPWIREGCVRCHYDVSRPFRAVSLRACRSCHDDAEQIVEAGIGTDLHPPHRGVGCITCHEPGAHDVVAMSSAVSLECSDCHRAPHDLRPSAPASPGTAVCVDCHRETHADQQRLLLGLVPGTPVSPSYKYLSGLACGSCHADVEGDVPPARAVGGRPEACAACHRPEYRRVLDWWREGATQRVRRARSFRDRAERALGTADTVGSLLGRAEVLVALVDRAGAQHNLALSDRLLRTSVELVEEAYRAAGRGIPARPDLGRRPVVGFCSYCHYRVGEPAAFEEMPEDFHQGVWERLEELRERGERRRGRGGTGGGGEGTAGPTGPRR